MAFAIKLEKLELDEVIAEAKKALATAQKYLNENDFNHPVFFLKKTVRLLEEKVL